VKAELDSRNRGYMSSNAAKLYESIDLTKFREDIDVRTIINIIVWTLEGFANTILKTPAKSNDGPVDYEKAFADSSKYIEIFKCCFYKQN
jgi:TetR/AcrR family transcriptional regulator